MGSGASKVSDGVALSRKITQTLIDDFNKENQKIKLLLLGAGESGKTTVLKQMKILHHGGFSDATIAVMKVVIQDNLLTVVRALISAMEALGIPFAESQRQADVQSFLEECSSFVNKSLSSVDLSDSSLLQMGGCIGRIWQDAGAKDCFRRRHEFDLMDSAEYLLNNVGRILVGSYTPTNQDILIARSATTGIVEVPFAFGGTMFRVFDVGGQRSERRKWIHCFDNVDAIIFMVAMSDYSRTMSSDAYDIRLMDSLQLFCAVCNSRWFLNLNIILFLNKKDIFEERIKKQPITCAFPDYKGPQTYEHSATFIELKFYERNENPSRSIYSHKTCSTDTEQIRTILDASLQTVISSNMKNVGLLNS